MAEFTEVMRQYKRMCYGKSCCDCDFYKFKTSINYQMACLRFLKEYPIEAEALVMNWAKEHPVVYPTWMEWLTDVGAIPKTISWDEPLIESIYDAIQEHIPADTAQKLGIEPKEG